MTDEPTIPSCIICYDLNSNQLCDEQTCTCDCHHDDSQSINDDYEHEPLTDEIADIEPEDDNEEEHEEAEVYE